MITYRTTAAAVITLLIGACQSSLSGRLVSQPGTTFSREARVNVVRLDQSQSADGSIDESKKSWLVEVSSDGSFAIRESLPAGTYLIEALVPGYKPTSVHLDLQKKKTVELNLQPATKTKVKSLKANMDIEVERGASGSTSLTPPQL